MKKKYLFLAFLMLFALVINGNAQTYSLKDLSATDFATGGNTNWSFEMYDIATGTYSPFTTYGSTGQMNYFDRYNTERYAGYPIMSNPANLGGAYDTKRNGWYNLQNDFLYVARDYEDGTANVNLNYWTSIPDSLRGYEVYSSPLFVGNPYRNAAITFLTPADGYYRVDMAVLREDNIRTDPMTVFQHYRYSGIDTVSDVSHLNQSFTYGAGGNTTLPVPPESPVVKAPWANAQKPVHKTFYVYSHAGDKISFEADARSTNNPESAIRGEYGRTKWTNLALTVVTEATAKADPSKFQDPYNIDPTLKGKLDSLLSVAGDMVTNWDVSKYPKAAEAALESVYTTISNEYSTIQPLAIQNFITQITDAIGKYNASSLGLKAQYIFNNVVNGVVPDASGLGNAGTLVNQATILPMGKYNVLNLGTSNGYMNMGANVGNVISTMSNYTISAYYRVDPSVTLSGNGLFLWTFTTQTTSGASNGQYIYYQLQNQRMAVASAGYNSEKAVTLTAAANKGAWQHVVYTQNGTVGQLYINGVMVKSTDPMPVPSAVFTTSTPYNWIGRPGFNDPYLSKTLIYDVRLYNQSVPTDSITKWASLTTDLDHELNYGSVGNFTALSNLISQYTTFLAGAVVGTQFGQYTQAAKNEFNDAIIAAQAIVTANNVSQYYIDAQAANLTTAYNKFLASANTGLNNLAEGEYFFKVNSSYVNNPGAALAANGQVPSVANQGILTNRIIDNAGEIFKLSLVTSLTPARYSIFSTLDETGVKRHITETCVYQSAWGTPGGGTANGDDNWRTFNIFNNGTACAIQCGGASANKGYWTYDATNQKLADSNNATTAQYLFNFIPVKTVFAEEVANGRTKFNSAVVGTDLGQYPSGVYAAFKTALEAAEATVTSANGTSADLITYGAARKLFLANGETAVNNVLDNNLKVIAGNRSIRMSAENAVKVTVYNVTGEIVSEAVVTGERTIAVNSGLYLVKTGGRAIKVLVR